MTDLDKDLKLAQEEMHSGSLERASEILLSLQKLLTEGPVPEDLTEEERLRGLVKVYNNLGVVLKNKGDFEGAAESLQQAFETADLLHEENVRMRTGILSNLGLLHSRCKRYSKALDAFDKAVQLARRHPEACDEGILIKLRNNRALFFLRFGEPEKAREELARALEPGRVGLTNGNEKEREAWLNANLAMMHAELAEEGIYDPSRQEELYRQARTMFLKSAELYGEEGYALNRIKQIVNAAEIDVRLKMAEEAKRHLDEAKREAERLTDPRLLCEIAHVCCELALLTGDRESIDMRVREAVKVFQETTPTDMPSRLARLEGILRRSGNREALDIIADFKKNNQPGRDVKKRTPK